MQKFTRIIILIVLAGGLLLSSSTYAEEEKQVTIKNLIGQLLLDTPPKKIKEKGWYIREDHQYFRTLTADIRRPYTHMRFYRDPKVVLTNSEPGYKNKDHLFWDVAFGDLYTLFGYHTTNPRTARTKGVDLFAEPAIHMLLDFNAKSNAVINADYRLGFGLRGRSIPIIWKGGWFSWRLKGFHESTHIGDEYIIDAQKLFPQEFKRYNVSYEAIDIFISADHMTKQTLFFIPQDSYGKIYVGRRWLNKGNYKEESKDSDSFLSGKDELQVGFEIFYRVKPTALKGVNLAVDFYRRYKYDLIEEKRDWGKNYVLGFVFGELFQKYENGYAIGRRSIAIQFNHYRGPNPHGQFRDKKIKYWGVDYSIAL